MLARVGLLERIRLKLLSPPRSRIPHAHSNPVVFHFGGQRLGDVVSLGSSIVYPSTGMHDG